MRHRVAGWKLGRNTSHRRALLRNLVTSLILEERIETTVPKAKAMRPHVERMIALGKRGDLAARRQAAAYLMTGEAVKRLFDVVGALVISVPFLGKLMRAFANAIEGNCKLACEVKIVLQNGVARLTVNNA